MSEEKTNMNFNQNNEPDKNTEQPRPDSTPVQNQQFAQPNPSYQYNTDYYTYQSSQSQNGMYSYPSGGQPVEPIPPKKEKKQKRGVGTVISCVILSLIFGFSGAFGALFLNNSLDLIPTSGIIGGDKDSKKVVIYEKVEGPDDADKAAAIENAGVIAKVAETALPSVVEIRTEAVAQNFFYGQYITEGAGSGVIISEDGYIVTNNHVISGTSSITVHLYNGDEHKAELVGTDPQNDIAVIKINAKGLKPAVYGNSDNLIVGELTVAIGNPLGELGNTVTNGIVSALDREITVDGENMTLLQTSAAVNPGNSGGGLFNSNGNLIGIVNAKSSGTNIEGLGFAIPINTAKPIIEELIKNGFVTGRPSIGITVVEVMDENAKYMYKVSEYGVYIQSSTNGDFKKGDRIIAIDGNSVSKMADIKTLLKDYKVGDKVTVTVSRQNKIVDVSVNLIESASK